MYLPKHFEQSNLETLHEFIEQHSFGLLISSHNQEHQASHLPLLLERDIGPKGEIIGHMARANSQWQAADGAPVLTVFSGPHAYVSPTWYEAEHVVPTWNYVAVHAYGSFRAIHDAKELTAIVHAYVRRYERGMPTPWHIERPLDGGTTNQFIDRLVQQIVGFRIPIDRIEGKWKLSQNHPRERREKVVSALFRQGGEQAAQIAGLMRAELDVDSIRG